jgi:lysozyme
MTPSEFCFNLIREFEGCKLRSYQDSVGVWTIGWGHTQDVQEGQTILQEQADALLEQDAQAACSGMNELVKVTLTQNQVDALTSWTYNLGIGNLKESTLLRLLNLGQYDQVPEQMQKWVYAGGEVLPGLVKRRAAEAALWGQSN